MGYVHITDISQFIPPSQIQKSAGTWTPSGALNMLLDVRTAAAAEFDLLIPIVLPGSHIARQGAKLVSIDVWYTVGTAACAAFDTVILSKETLPASGTGPSGAEVTTTIDALHNTEAERIAVGQHKMTVTLNTPAFIEDDEAYFLLLTIEGAATTVINLVGAQANFTLRL